MPLAMGKHSALLKRLQCKGTSITVWWLPWLGYSQETFCCSPPSAVQILNQLLFGQVLSLLIVFILQNTAITVHIDASHRAEQREGGKGVWNQRLTFDSSCYTICDNPHTMMFWLPDSKVMSVLYRNNFHVESSRCSPPNCISKQKTWKKKNLLKKQQIVN